MPFLTYDVKDITHQNSSFCQWVMSLMNVHKTSILKSILFIITIPLLMVSCSNDDEPNDDSLSAYFNGAGLTKVNELIACASGGQAEVFSSSTHPIAVFFLPEGNATNFRYFETDDLIPDNTDFTAYHEVLVNDVPVFGGFLRYFEREPITNERWAIVTFEMNGSLHYSNPIRLKFSEKPTEFNPSLLTFDQSEILSPRFTWQDGMIDENAIYFHVITNSNGDLVSGTYTIEKTWQFYDLSNVVLNINDVTPAPALMANDQYQYHMLAVSLDNWVNLITQRNFNTF